MSNIVEFPAEKVEREWSKAEVDELHAQAFCDLEPRLNDCVSMAAIAFHQITELKTEDRELVFAVAHAWEMLVKLKRDYYAAWHDEKPGGLHTSNI